MTTKLGERIILTHPLAGNYGGILQAYALWRSVLPLSTSATLADYTRPHFSLLRILKKWVRYTQLTMGWGSEKMSVASSGYFGASYVGRKFKKNIRQYRCTSIADIKRAIQHNAIWIVGSDQVWRSRYMKGNVPFFFLDFLPEYLRRHSIAYAASFGTDEWEGTPEETERCRELLQQFKAVSVREHSGVKICMETFGVEAVQMPDPTLLPYPEDYDTIIQTEETCRLENRCIAAYILDEAAKPLQALHAVAEQMQLPVQHLQPHAKAKLRRDRFPISVPQWLRYMKECEFVVTDSFHGCVFAIIFNKPFVCLGNEGRGSARFDTLFQTFHLESRLATSPEQAVEVAQAPIDWDAVNAIHESERARGLAFLRENLMPQGGVENNIIE